MGNLRNFERGFSELNCVWKRQCCEQNLSFSDKCHSSTRMVREGMVHVVILNQIVPKIRRKQPKKPSQVVQDFFQYDLKISSVMHLRTLFLELYRKAT